MIQQTDIIDIFPGELKHPLKQVLSFFGGDVYEIRLIASKCVFLCTSSGIRFVNRHGFLEDYPSVNGLTVGEGMLNEIIERAMAYSGFAYENELRQCFLTRSDGTRIGIAYSGNSGSLQIGRVMSLNIRLPVCTPCFVLPELDNILLSGGGVLIAGAPNSGKTTLLRYCCKALAGAKLGIYKKVCVIDERGELHGNGGVFDLGDCTDVISCRPKHDGILTALRLMSPDYIVCDEIGSCAETESILEGLNSGVDFIATMHAANIGQLIRRSQFLRLFYENVFSYIVFLSAGNKGTVEKIYTHGDIADEIYRCGNVIGGSVSDSCFAEYK